jgi:hypothetical protein
VYVGTFPTKEFIIFRMDNIIASSVIVDDSSNDDDSNISSSSIAQVLDDSVDNLIDSLGNISIVRERTIDCGVCMDPNDYDGEKLNLLLAIINYV